MSKIEEIIKLKKLLDEGLISQNDFETLKNNLFENSKSLDNSFENNIVDGNQNNIKHCPDCGNKIKDESNICEFCNINSFDIIDENNKSNKKIFIIIGLVLLLILLIYSLMNTNIFNKSKDALSAQDSTQVEIIDTINSVKTMKADTLTTIEDDSVNQINLDSTTANYSENYNQNIDDNDDIDNNKYNVSEIEVKPDFPGGIGNFYKFIGNNYQVPGDVGLNGKVYVSFIVEKDGSLSDIKVINDIGYGTGDEAIRVLKASPKWYPGQQNGKKVRVFYSLSISVQSPD